ncbi:MAG TPA: magnesium chelatase domain-containing protein [Candidatus Dormibacteraeota bacterium]|nr:magnesium chelatase domain-containing protein [Candidatus Dormibacteraeota bacterium]
MGLEFPVDRVTVNLAPAKLRNEGAAFGLPGGGHPLRHVIHFRRFPSRAYASGVANGLRGFRLRFCNVGCH